MSAQAERRAAAEPLGLWRRIGGRPADDVLWIAASDDPNRESVTRVLDVQSVREGPLARSCANRRVALALDRVGDTATALCALDGIVSALLLLPREVSGDERLSLIERFAADVVLVGPQESDVAESVGSRRPDLAVRSWDAQADVPALEPSATSSRTSPIETEWVLATSGTTATPRLVSHSLGSLTRTTRTVRTAPQSDSASSQGPASCWGLLYEIERFAGLQVFLQALWSRAVLLIPPSVAPTEPTLRFLERHDCNSVSCTPSWARRAMLSAASRDLSLRQLTLGGEIADDSILAALRAAYPEARLVHIYASTEAGVGFTVRDGMAGFPSSYLESSVDGVELDVRDGRLWIRPPESDQVYLDGAPTGDGTFPSHVADETGWIDTGDLVRREGERHVFLGRAAGAINVGGSKVLPEEVEATILQVEGVEECLVRGRRSGLTGELVEAFVVGSSSDDDLLARVKEHCRAHLPKYKRPALLRAVDELELAAAGKKSRRAAGGVE